MSGKMVGGFIVSLAIIAGLAMYYLQVYAYYDRVAPTGIDDVQLIPIMSSTPEPILYENFEAIDSQSSPIRYRACFATPMSLALLSETYEGTDDAVPLVAPGWFDCFDADYVGKALESGEALAFVGHRNIQYGIDRVVAIFSDGRGYVWNQLNDCGEAVFGGEPAPDHCPEQPAN